LHENQLEIAYHKTLLPDPAMMAELVGCGVEERRGEERKRYVRLPWIHKREDDFFQSPKIPPWKNQDTVPL